MERKHFIPIGDFSEKKRYDSGYYAIIDKKGGFHLPPEEMDMKSKIKKHCNTYKEYINAKYQNLEFTGLDALLPEGLLLENFYISLRVRPSSRIDDCSDINDFKELDKDDIDAHGHDFEAVFQQMVEASSTQDEESLMAVILGKPGSGKTTLLKWIALQCVNQTGKYPFEQLTPIFIPLRELSRDPDGTYRERKILEVAMDLINKEFTDTAFLNDLFVSGRILFLLDGLDEVADENLREEVIRWIQVQDIHRNCMLVTSRYTGLHDDRELNFRGAVPILALQDFNTDNMAQFLKNWFAAVTLSLTAKTTGNQNESENEKSKAQQEAIKQTETLLSLLEFLKIILRNSRMVLLID